MLTLQHDPFDSQATDAVATEQELAQRLARDAELSDWLWLLAHKQGRRIVRRMLEYTGPLRQTFVPGDAPTSDFNEGVRNVGLWLTSELVATSPERYLVMLAEHLKGSR